MSRLSQLRIQDATGDAANLFSAIRKAVGKVPNAYVAIGSHSPAALSLLLQGEHSLTSLPKADVEAVRLAISTENGCDYCVAAHSLVGKSAGVPEGQLRSIREGGLTGDGKRDALLRFAKEVSMTSGPVDAARLDRVLSAGYTQQQVVELLMVIALIAFTNMFNRVNDTEIDFPSPA